MFIGSSSTSLSGNRKGFTLLEILIAVFILAVVISTVYAAYSGTFRIIKESEGDAEAYGMARNAMHRMLKDLNSVSAVGGNFTFVSRTSGVAEAGFTDLTFISNSHLAFSENESSAGLAKITYYVEEDASGEGYRLMRRDIPYTGADNEESSHAGFILCEKLKSLRYTFIDVNGKEHDSWDSLNGAAGEKNRAPAIAAIELKLAKGEDRSYTFETKVFLPLSATVSSTPQ
jgi:general secretion pathway protein J